MYDLNFATVQRMPELHSSVIEEGASFENTFISYPLCCPSRATILTGLYAHNHDVRGNAPPDRGFEKFRDEGYKESTIAVRLQQSGYETGLFGEYLNYYLDEDSTHVPPGWDERWTRSPTGTPRASSGTAATATRPNCYDRCSNPRVF